MYPSRFSPQMFSPQMFFVSEEVVDAVKKIKMPAVRSSCDGHSPSSVECLGISFLGFRTSRSAGRAEFFTLCLGNFFRATCAHPVFVGIINIKKRMLCIGTVEIPETSVTSPYLICFYENYQEDVLMFFLVKIII